MAHFYKIDIFAWSKMNNRCVASRRRNGSGALTEDWRAGNPQGPAEQDPVLPSINSVLIACVRVTTDAETEVVLRRKMGELATVKAPRNRILFKRASTACTLLAELTEIDTTDAATEVVLRRKTGELATVKAPRNKIPVDSALWRELNDPERGTGERENEREKEREREEEREGRRRRRREKKIRRRSRRRRRERAGARYQKSKSSSVEHSRLSRIGLPFTGL